MSYHTDKEVISLASVMAKKVLEYDRKCRNDEYKKDMKCEALADAVAMARLICADTGDTE